jgi:hypothetical protein
MWEVKRMNAAANILLITANDAGGSAAYLGPRSGSTGAVAQVPTTGVLVAPSDIGPGTHLMAASLFPGIHALSLTTTQK